MKVIANRQLCGEYGVVVADQEFDVRDEIAVQLLHRHLVRKPDPPQVHYETKVIVPAAPEVSPREPFRDLPLLDAESPDVAPEGDRVLPATELPQPGTADPVRRGGRSRSGSGGRSTHQTDPSDRPA